MNALAEIIRHEILERGPMSFARFMEMALYYPELGYYERPSGSVGRRGDFFTNVSVGSVFGELLAYQFAEWLDELRANAATSLTNVGAADLQTQSGSGQDSAGRTFQIVEAGAHDGRMALDVLSWLRRSRSDLLTKLEYWILEPSAVRQKWQAHTLRKFDEHVRWFPSWEPITPNSVCGVIFSNELLDSFPAHRVAWDASERRWFEWGVAWQEDHFAWTKVAQGMPSNTAADPPLRWPDPPLELLAVLPSGFTTETSPAAGNWWEQAANALRRGKLLTIDYGLRSGEFFAPERVDGTLRAYHRHQVRQDLLARVGEQDLTAHVNFSVILQRGEQAGLRTETLIPQSKFLTEIAAKIDRSPKTFDAWTSARIRQFQTLIHPEHLGRPFQVLVQSR